VRQKDRDRSRAAGTDRSEIGGDPAHLLGDIPVRQARRAVRDGETARIPCGEFGETCRHGSIKRRRGKRLETPVRGTAVIEWKRVSVQCHGFTMTGKP